MTHTNLLFIMADEHAREGLGCYGGACMKTPHLDGLAARGTRFTNAYTPSPVCVPARASLATGRWVHEIGCWSSAEPYHGQVPSWGHRLIESGHRVSSIGKLHYRATGDSNGFDEELLPLHVLNGVGWARGLLRDPLPAYEATRELAEQIGAGETSYTAYDREIFVTACDWLRAHADYGDKPWVLFVSFVSPHYPLVAPREFFDLYPIEQVDLPRSYRPDQRPTHPVLRALSEFFNYDDYFDEEKLRRARASYYGLCSFIDHNVGRLLGALAESGQSDRTRIIYTSDHGEMLGHHGLWTKSVLYEESAAIPLIIAGPDIPAGGVAETPVSLVDCYPTIVEAVGEPLSEEDRPGHSLLHIAGGEKPDRTVLSEYHDGGSITGQFMIRVDQWKYVYYPGYPPQLFDLAADPYETTDLGANPSYDEVRARCDAKLREIVDPDAVNAEAFADQRRKIEVLGGEAALLAIKDFGYTPLSDTA